MQSSKTRVKTIVIGFLIIVIVLYVSVSPKDSIFEITRIRQNAVKNTQNLVETDNSTIKCDKWVVVTTINNPTWHVKYIRDSLYEWCVVIVADKKTPQNWFYKDVVFLSVERQELMSLDYQIIQKIPYNSYLRKMVGYLYAIRHGAKYIYDTDDDNSPLDALLGFRYNSFKGLVCDSNETFINPYSYFGQTSVWPRGYPLSKISESNKCKSYKVYPYSDDVPIIQQGLVNGDPDVDAIYRLTRKYYNEKIDLNFDANAPPLLLSSTQYAPLNSQNTFFHYNAFWSLILPMSVSFRECDIYRGYLSVRLVREIAGRIAFFPPNTIQIRNSHSYFDDFKDEERLYNDIEALVEGLDNWKCTKDTFEECFIDCIQHLVNLNQLGESEIDFYTSWINDLTMLGYKWPELKDGISIKSSLNNFDVLFKAKEQLHSSNANSLENSLVMLSLKQTEMEELWKRCDLKLRKIEPCKIDNIVIITEAASFEDLKYIEFTVGLHFSYLAVCYFGNRQDILNYTNTRLSILTFENSRSFEECVSGVMKMGYKQQSFFITKNITAFEFWRIHRKHTVFENLNRNKVEYNNDIIFQRNTVANGKRLLKINSNPNITIDLCDIYKAEEEQQVCDNILNAIESLNWHKNDMATESCENIKSHQIWIPDLHDGPRVDITSVLVHLGQKPVLAGHKGGSSPFPEALALGKISSQLSKFILTQTSHSSSLNEDLAIENFNYYKINSTDFISTDAVICSFPASMCEAFMPLNVTIILNPAHRYNLGRCTLKRWEKYNENIYKLYSKSKVVLAAMSRYDEEYLRQFTGLKGYKLYAYGGYYAKGIKYNPNKPEILVGPANHLGRLGKNLTIGLNNYSEPLGVKFVGIRTLYPRYTLKELANHPAIILFPYAVMSYSIIDFYISTIPIFIPSIELLTKWKNVNDRCAYCHNVSYLSLEMLKNVAYEVPHKYNSNSDKDDDYSYWLQYADYYQWPFVTIYNSWEDLVNKIKTLDLNEISENMRKFNQAREAMLLDNWCKLLNSLKKPNVSKSYEDFLNYYKMKSLTGTI